MTDRPPLRPRPPGARRSLIEKEVPSLSTEGEVGEEGQVTQEGSHSAPPPRRPARPPPKRSPPAPTATTPVSEEERPVCPNGPTCESNDPDHWVSHSHTEREWKASSSRKSAPPESIAPLKAAASPSGDEAAKKKGKGRRDTLASSTTSAERPSARKSGKMLGGMRQRFKSLRRNEHGEMEVPEDMPTKAKTPPAATRTARASSTAAVVEDEGGAAATATAATVGSAPVQRRNWKERTRQYQTLEQVRKSYSKSGGGGSPGVSSGSRVSVLADDKRSKVLRELLNTEADYVRDLTLIVNLYMEPLLSREVISPDEVKRIFSNVRELLQVNTDLLEQLEQAVEGAGKQGTVADAFMRTIPLFRLYTVYLSNQDAALRTVVELMRTNSSFHTFTMYTQMRPESRNLDLKSFLIKPVQRVCKYPLLIKELVKATAEDDPEVDGLREALEKLSESVQHMNAKKKELENTTQMLDCQAKLPDAKDLLQPGRRYVAEGEVVEFDKGDWSSSAGLYYFFFTDLLIVGKVRKVSRSRYFSLLSGKVEKLAETAGAAEPEAPEGAPQHVVTYTLEDQVLLHMASAVFSAGPPPVLQVFWQGGSRFLRVEDKRSAERLERKVERAAAEKKLLDNYRRYLEIHKRQSTKGSRIMQSMSFDEFKATMEKDEDPASLSGRASRGRLRSNSDAESSTSGSRISTRNTDTNTGQDISDDEDTLTN